MCSDRYREVRTLVLSTLPLGDYMCYPLTPRTGTTSTARLQRAPSSTSMANITLFRLSEHHTGVLK